MLLFVTFLMFFFPPLIGLSIDRIVFGIIIVLYLSLCVCEYNFVCLNILRLCFLARNTCTHIYTHTHKHTYTHIQDITYKHTHTYTQTYSKRMKTSCQDCVRKIQICCHQQHNQRKHTPLTLQQSKRPTTLP